MDHTQPPHATNPEEAFPPYVEETNRCMHNSWNQDPGPSAGEICPKYGCYSCCNEARAVEHYAQGFSGTKITHYGPYRFDGCTSEGKHDVSNSGHLSENCQAFITNNHCLTACSPNVYIWFAKTGAAGRLYDHVSGMKVCPDFCQDFYNACKEDYICYNQDGMKEYVVDLVTTGLSEEKDYKIHHCEGAYQCQKIKDSYIAKQFDLPGIMGSSLPSASGSNSMQSKNEMENFCKRFSFGMYDQENLNGAPCIDPRNEDDIIKYVHRFEKDYNANIENLGNERTFPTTNECPVGLSTGAVIGIVIGSLIVVFGLVAGILVLSKRDSDKNKKYEAGQIEADEITQGDRQQDETA